MSPEQTLCGLCDSIDIVATIKDLSAYQTKTIAHHPSYAELIATATSCRLCAVFQASLYREGRSEQHSTGKSHSVPIDAFRKTSNVSLPSEYIRRSSTPKSFLTRLASSGSEITRTDSGTGIVDDVVGWHEELDRKGGNAGFLIEIKAESTMDAGFALEYFVRYQRPMAATGSVVEGPKPRPLVLSNERDLGLGILNRPIGTSPDFSVYSAWIRECAYGSKHVRCSRVGPVDLPTRLIDVGTGSGSSIPKLVTTAGMRGQYLTLSHCWGKHRIIITTTNNMATHLEGIHFAQFPQMFKDAMLITKIMGFRYIWIDSLCIIQDDVGDWEKECARMGDVYRNSVCTLAAPSASDSHTGLTTPRSLADIPSCRLKAQSNDILLGNVTIGPPSSGLKEHTGVLSTRAWVLQEQVLSPRTLCFGHNGMYFQCHSHERLESYHHALPPELVTSWRTSQATDLPKPLIAMASSDAIYWYSIVRQYSFRRLTIGSDKLPAISGLAKYIAGKQEEEHEISELGEYWAGLWSVDLGRGLIWISDASWDSTNILHKVDDSIPSWSWASQNTPVVWTGLRDFQPDFECISGQVDRVSSHYFGRVSGGRLELDAPAKSARLQRSQLPGTKSIFLRGIADIREVAELCLDNTCWTFFRATWPEADPMFSCRLLLLGKSESSLYGSRWYALVLVPLGDGKYRRVGVANSLGGESAHVRSLSAEQSYDWFGNARTESVVIV